MTITPAVCNAPAAGRHHHGHQGRRRGTFSVGGTVTYTVTLTNTGTGAQADNAGNEFTDTLPAALTLVSATATSGTAAATRHQHGHLERSLAPLGGSGDHHHHRHHQRRHPAGTISNQGRSPSTPTATAPTMPTASPTIRALGGRQRSDLVRRRRGAAITATKTATGTFR